MNIKDILGKEFLVFDGAMGSLLQKKGLTSAELPETWNLTHRDVIIDIHREYLMAGANIIKTNTFGANRLKFREDGAVEEVVRAAVSNAREAISSTPGTASRFVALDIGPTGKLLKPFGDLDFEEAVSIFAQMIRAGEKDADLILIETMNDLYETKAAVVAAKENSNLPVFVTNAYGISGNLMTGASPETVCVTLEGLGVDAIGINCSFGPKEMLPVVKKLTELCSVPVIVNPNAGLPDYSDGKATYRDDENQFAQYMKEIISLGVHVVGGCCGTTPAYISELSKILENQKFSPPYEKNVSAVSSYNRTVFFGETPAFVGEQINPETDTGFKDALKSQSIDCIIDMGLDQEDAGANVLAVCVECEQVDEKEAMIRAITELQSVTALPLRIDTSDSGVLESALRIYNGKAMINCVNVGEECMTKVFPVVKKYGGVVVVHPFEENEITSNTSKIHEIAERIHICAAEYGLSKKDIIICFPDESDCLADISDIPFVEQMSAVISAGKLAERGAECFASVISPESLLMLHCEK